ncbi:M28 family peptidase [Flaviaesturariibacter flavus]|uniref:M28 family peptidase n=1 Tax=Flaviaesturariibacter flavus TaxID=2502780 RepID=A0A4R1B9G2_9BACT|nr:M28 family peptidase [Flaviaesturariibacter flavus]TCJ13539.1 M28 family peptidase [Flaviaesturariibacter flavus]
MKRLFLASALLVACCSVQAQKKKAAANPKLFAASILPADLKKHLYIIAGPEMEGRETATPGQKKAAAYIENHFRTLGLEPGANGSYQQVFNVYQDALQSARLEVNGQSFTIDKDFNPQTASNISGTFRFSEVVALPADTNAVKAADLTGRLVILYPSSSAGRIVTRAIATTIRSKGAAAILTVSPTYPRNAGNRAGAQSIYSFRRTVDPQQYSISEAVARAIVGADFDALKNGSITAKTISSEVLLETTKNSTVLQSSNVVGVLPGTDLKDEYLFITAHYDHLGKRGDSVIFYGADDDGSGTVGVLELAEAFSLAKKAGKGPRRTIVFMTVSGEEKGLWGSEYYSNHPLFPLEKTTADLNIDMIGRSDVTRKGDTTNYIYVVGDDKISSDLKPISEAANRQYTKLELDYKFNDVNDPNQIYYRSDHYNFARKGVPIIFYYDGMLGSDYHRPTDTPDKIHYELAAKRAQLVFYTGWEMANRDSMLKRDIELPAMRR